MCDQQRGNFLQLWAGCSSGCAAPLPPVHSSQTSLAVSQAESQEVCGINATEFLLEIFQRDNPDTVSSTRHTLRVYPANYNNLRKWLALIWSDAESLTYVSQTSGPTTETPNSPSSVSTAFQSAIWWQTQLLPSVQICLVTDTAASSNLFLGEIMKRRYLCFKIFWKTDILPVTD